MSPASTPRSILIVDDDDDIRELLRFALESDGYRVEDARGGAEALELLRTVETPDLAIVDLMMPVMNGQELATALRSSPATSRLPLLVMSGDPRACDRALQMQALACLVKPVELEDLLATVARALPSSGS